jgi:hypothetical protein
MDPIMTLYEKIIAAFPELTDNIDLDRLGIVIQNDSDGTGDYIAQWDYSKPLIKELQTHLR